MTGYNNFCGNHNYLSSFRAQQSTQNPRITDQLVRVDAHGAQMLKITRRMTTQVNFLCPIKWENNCLGCLWCLFMWIHGSWPEWLAFEKNTWWMCAQPTWDTKRTLSNDCVTHTRVESSLLATRYSRVDRVHGVAGAKEAAVAAVALVDQGVAARPTLDHRIEVPGGSLGRVVRQAFILKNKLYKVLHFLLI